MICENCEAELTKNDGRCPMCGAIVNEAMVAENPELYFNDDRGIEFKKKYDNTQATFRILFECFSILFATIFIFYSIGLIANEGFSSWKSWFFQYGIGYVIIIGLLCGFLALLASRHRKVVLKWFAIITMVLYFLINFLEMLGVM